MNLYKRSSKKYYKILVWRKGIDNDVGFASFILENHFKTKDNAVKFFWKFCKENCR